jgi:hypothetical protein
VWGYIGGKLRAEQIKDQDELFEKIKKHWEKYYQDFSTKMASTMPVRVEALIKNKGCQLKYWSHACSKFSYMMYDGRASKIQASETWRFTVVFAQSSGLVRACQVDFSLVE